MAAPAGPAGPAGNEGAPPGWQHRHRDAIGAVGQRERAAAPALSFRNLSHPSLLTRTRSGATRCRVTVTVFSGRHEDPVPSSQFSEEHPGKPVNLSSPCA